MRGARRECRRGRRVAFRVEQSRGEFIHGLEAILARLGQRAQDDAFDGAWQKRVDGARGWHGGGDVLDDDFAVALAAKWDLAGQHFEQDHAERVDVGAVVDVRFAFALLGRHVVGRSHDRAGARLVRNLFIALGQLGQAEIEHLHEVGHVPLGDEEDVFGLEVAVDDAVLVG